MIALVLCVGADAQKRPVKRPVKKVTTTKTNAPAKNTSAGKAIIKLQNSRYNFGKVKLGQTKKYEFVFKNEGDAKLVILDSNVFCSCMKVTIPSAPIEPGQSGKIIMEFTGQEVGEFMKNAQIYTNCEQPMIRLNIEGEVIE